MDQSKNQVAPFPPNYGPYPINPNIIRRYPTQIPKAHHGISSCAPFLPLNTTIKLGYWELLLPALFGAAGAFFLSLFSGEKNDLIERFGGTLFKLAIIGYSIGATIAVSFAVSSVISQVLNDPKVHDDSLVYPIGGAIASVILLFTTEYLLLHRFFPSSFKGDVGDDFFTQFFSFLYFSITTIATGTLGDILPGNLTARALISTEIAFNLFTLATGIQLLLTQKS